MEAKDPTHNQKAQLNDFWEVEGRGKKEIKKPKSVVAIGDKGN